MSREALLGLDEFFDYKNQLVDDILTNESIVKLMSDDGETVSAPESLMYTQVFPYEFVPNVTEHGILAYFENYDDHNRILKLRRLFYAVFGFSAEHIEEFRKRGIKGEVHCS